MFYLFGALTLLVLLAKHLTDQLTIPTAWLDWSSSILNEWGQAMSLSIALHPSISDRLQAPPITARDEEQTQVSLLLVQLCCNHNSITPLLNKLPSRGESLV